MPKKTFKKLLAGVRGTVGEFVKGNTKKNVKSLMAGKKRKPQKGNRKAGGYHHPKAQKYADLDEAGDISSKKKKKK